MNTLTFVDGTTFKCLSVLGDYRSAKGTNRDCLTFNFDAEVYSADDLLNAFKDETKISKIIIGKDDNSETYMHLDYCIFCGLKIEEIVKCQETNNNPAEISTIISVTLGQMTYSEKLEKERNEQLESLSEAVADIIGGAM